MFSNVTLDGSESWFKGTHYASLFSTWLKVVNIITASLSYILDYKNI